MEGKELTLVELRRLEEYVYADRKRRELEVARMRRVAEEHKLQNERVEKRAVSCGEEEKWRNARRAEEGREKEIKRRKREKNRMKNNIESQSIILLAVFGLFPSVNI